MAAATAARARGNGERGAQERRLCCWVSTAGGPRWSGVLRREERRRRRGGRFCRRWRRGGNGGGDEGRRTARRALQGGEGCRCRRSCCGAPADSAPGGSGATAGQPPCCAAARSHLRGKQIPQFRSLSASCAALGHGGMVTNAASVPRCLVARASKAESARSRLSRGLGPSRGPAGASYAKGLGRAAMIPHGKNGRVLKVPRTLAAAGAHVVASASSEPASSAEARYNLEGKAGANSGITIPTLLTLVRVAAVPALVSGAPAVNLCLGQHKPAREGTSARRAARRAQMSLRSAAAAPGARPDARPRCLATELQCTTSTLRGPPTRASSSSSRLRPRTGSMATSPGRRVRSRSSGGAFSFPHLNHLPTKFPDSPAPPPAGR